jgi:hypothetical protein
MAPEQWNPAKGVDHRTDIYALAIILFQMLTGELPFTGGQEELMASHLMKTPPDPRDWRKDLPEGVTIALRRAMEKEKDARFATVEEFADAVAAALKMNVGSRPGQRDDTAAIRDERPEAGPRGTCASCETPGVPHAVGGSLYCPNCGSLWSAAAANAGAAGGAPAAPRSIAPQEGAAARPGATAGKCAACGQHGVPDVISARQYCSSCGAAWMPALHDAGSVPEFALEETKSWVCANGHSGEPSVVGGVPYCEDCGLPMQEIAAPARPLPHSWVGEDLTRRLSLPCPACGSTKAPVVLGAGAYCEDCGASRPNPD